MYCEINELADAFEKLIYNGMAIMTDGDDFVKAQPFNLSIFDSNYSEASVIDLNTNETVCSRF